MSINPQAIINLIESTNSALDNLAFRQWAAASLRQIARSTGWLGPVCEKESLLFHIHPKFEEHLNKLRLVEQLGLKPR